MTVMTGAETPRGSVRHSVSDEANEAGPYSKMPADI
jgi:hypothetical protein